MSPGRGFGPRQTSIPLRTALTPAQSPPRPMNTHFTAFAMIGWQEALIPAVILLLLFGGRKLPELARAMGSSITQFKKGLKETDGPAGEIEGEDKQED